MEGPLPNLVPSETLSQLTKKVGGMPKVVSAVLIVLAVGLGIFSGYLLGGQKKVEVLSGGSGIVPESKIVKGSEFGLKDASTFKDTATGVLEAGGLEGEGTHKLLREGGPSQTVYLTSSVLDLDQFVGKKIQIWGETNRGQKAGWLMDVGKVKILE